MIWHLPLHLPDVDRLPASYYSLQAHPKLPPEAVAALVARVFGDAIDAAALPSGGAEGGSPPRGAKAPKGAKKPDLVDLQEALRRLRAG